MPADEFSPGAGELEAPQRIADKAVKNGDDMKLIKAGCRWLDAKARERGEQNFVGLNEAGREAVTRLAESSEPGSMPWLFFQHTLDDTFLYYYYARRESWVVLGYRGPPQPRGFMHYTQPLQARMTESRYDVVVIRSGAGSVWELDLSKTLVVASTDGIVQQFALRPGDIVNPMVRPAGILVPDRKITGLKAGFGQIEAQVIKPGMVGEVTCAAKPWQIIPMVVTEIQNVIASGQVRATDTLVDAKQFAQPGNLTVIMQPLYPGQFDDLPLGGSCIANAYTSNHEALQDPNISTSRWLALHAIDMVGLVHAMILRIQALLLPIQTLVFGGH